MPDVVNRHQKGGGASYTTDIKVRPGGVMHDASGRRWKNGRRRGQYDWHRSCSSSQVGADSRRPSTCRRETAPDGQLGDTHNGSQFRW